MDWRHEASPRWMEARRDVITATEVASCVSAYNRATNKQKAGQALLPAFASLWARKQSSEQPETWSKGPAARGHILEPYAIADWNASQPRQFYHWDDCIIKSGGLGWSPDGLSVPQETYEPVVKEHNGRLCDGKIIFNSELPEYFIEVKSYGPDRIMKSRLTMPEKHEERWQMACAFVVLPSLKEGTILFYSIDTDLSFYHTYARDDLADEIKVVSDIVDLWDINVAKLKKSDVRFKRTVTEEQVYKEYLESNDDVLSI